jgi:hypothetical protein
LLCDFSRFAWLNSCFSFFIIPSRSSNMPLYPRRVVSQGVCPDSLFFHCSQFKLSFESIKELGSASMMLMHSYKQTNGTCGVFGRFCKVTKKNWMSNKGVVKFWHMNYLFWNLCFQVNLETCIFPWLDSTLQQHFDFGGPIFLILFPMVHGWWAFGGPCTN